MRSTQPIAIPVRLRLWLHASFVVCLSLALVSCFDAVARLSLKGDGSGTLSFRIVFTREVSGLIIAGQAGKPPPAINEQNKNASRRLVVKDGQLIQEEVVPFKSLSDLVSGDRIEVAVLGRTVAGATRNRVSWTVQIGNRGGKDQGAAQSAALFLAQHTFQVAMDLPCMIESAAHANIGSVAIAPSTASSSVSWTVPLPAMLAAPPGGPIVFSADCWSWQGIKPSVTRMPATTAQRAPPSNSPPPRSDPIAPPAMPEAFDIVLGAFPVLSQKDRGIYAPQSGMYSAMDYAPSNTNPDAKLPIHMLACAATVYVMIERGFGRGDAVIDDIYEPGRGKGAMPSRLIRATIGRKEPIDVAQIENQVREGLPVVMLGTGGPLQNHYVLIVGVAMVNDTVSELIVNDPWPGAGPSTAGRRVRLGAHGTIHNPGLGVTFSEMRLVTRKDNAVGGAATGLAMQPLRIDGIGPIRLGMTVADSLAAGIPLKEDQPSTPENAGCSYARPIPESPGLAFMLNDRRIVRIDVMPPSTIKSALGVGIGNSEREVMDAAARAGARAEVGPHKYVEGGHYVTVTFGGARVKNAFVFETDGQRVTSFRNGFEPQVHWVEHCL